MNHFYATALKCVGACAFADSFKVIYSVVGYLENFMIFIKYLGFFFLLVLRGLQTLFYVNYLVHQFPS